MNQVITVEQAKQITGGRTPLVPVEYESAIKALQACITLDESKYWSDKADALAAWAKIYRNDKVGVEAKRLKLHAYRRMGILAQELRPLKNIRKAGRICSTVGPGTAISEHGFSRNEAAAALKLASLRDSEFDRLISQPRPPAPTTVKRFSSGRTDAWQTFHTQGPAYFRIFIRKHDPAELARGLSPDEVPKAREVVNELSEWLDAFEQALPKQVKS